MTSYVAGKVLSDDVKISLINSEYTAIFSFNRKFLFDVHEKMREEYKSIIKQNFKLVADIDIPGFLGDSRSSELTKVDELNDTFDDIDIVVIDNPSPSYTDDVVLHNDGFNYANSIHFGTVDEGFDETGTIPGNEYDCVK